MLCAKCKIKEATNHCYCLDCRKEYDRQRYQDKKQLMLEQRNKYRKHKQDYLWEYKCNNKCANCIENDPACLDFHHKNPEDKEFQLSKANHSIENIKKEIEKCILLCANCHRKLHYYGTQEDTTH